jgi:hypothetical protein
MKKMNMTIEEKIEAKKKEITHYEGVLDRAFPSRWYSQGLRHMEDLKEELRKLQEEASK